MNRELAPELILLIAARSNSLTWIPWREPYTMDGYEFSQREWKLMVRELHKEGLLEKLIDRQAGITHHRGPQKSLTYFQISKLGIDYLERLGL